MTLRFTFRQLEYFIAVGELGSIAKAAESIHVSSPSISAAISQLENEFGIPLVRKHAHGLALTQAGKRHITSDLVEPMKSMKLVPELSGNIPTTTRLVVY